MRGRLDNQLPLTRKHLNYVGGVLDGQRGNFTSLLNGGQRKLQIFLVWRRRIHSLKSQKQKVKDILTKSEGFIKRELLKMVKLPFAPALEFIINIGEDNSERVNELLGKIIIPKEEDNLNNDDEF